MSSGTDLWLRQRGQKLCRPSWGKGPLTLGRSRNRCREDFTAGRDRQTLHWGFCEGKFKRRGDPRGDSQDQDCRQGSCPGKGRRTEGWAPNLSFGLASCSHPANPSTILLGPSVNLETQVYIASHLLLWVSHLFPINKIGEKSIRWEIHCMQLCDGRREQQKLGREGLHGKPVQSKNVQKYLFSWYKLTI